MVPLTGSVPRTVISYTCSILTAFPTRDQACHLYMMSVMAKYNCIQKDLLGHGGGGHTSKTIFLFPVCLIGEMVFQPKFIN